MTLEQQVTSLELSKKLKKLGVKQESAFVWMKCSPPGEGFFLHFCDYDMRTDDIPAFTVAELLNLLPGEITAPHGRAFLTYTRILSTNEHLFDYTYITSNEYDGTTAIEFETEDVNAADNLANLFIFLLEHKLITLP